MSSTVLVVDDDRANLDSVCRIFQKEGVTTLAASGGQEALEVLRRPEIGVVVTDLMMPGVDGQALLKASRAMRPDVEVVLMTAYATVETAVNAMREGAYDFVTKPLKRHSLVKAVQKAMEKQALVAENRDLKEQLARHRHEDAGGPVAGLSRLHGVARPSRAFDGVGAAHRRVGHRQGVGRSVHSRELSEGQTAIHRPQLRRRSPRASSRLNCSASRRERSPARWHERRAASSEPTEEPCFSTRSAR